MEAISKDELRQLLACARAHKQRDFLMILVAYSHGLRASEVVSLTRDNFGEGFLDVRRLKGSNRTVQPLVVSEDPLLNEHQPVLDYIQAFNRRERVFKITRQHFWRLMQKYAEQAGIPKHKRHPHVLKHSIAMQTIHSAGIENVRQYLGHKSMSSTGAYLKVNDQEASAAVGLALQA